MMKVTALTLTVANLEVFSLTRSSTAAPTLSARGKIIPDDIDDHHDYLDLIYNNINDNDDGRSCSALMLMSIVMIILII